MKIGYKRSTEINVEYTVLEVLRFFLDRGWMQQAYAILASTI